ncbi:MAG: RelA/SpoT family protein [Neisseriaceae bacterium]|nr:MAG: RelA/SpoT family protein [Neisseriaceae bacterium]
MVTKLKGYDIVINQDYLDQSQVALSNISSEKFKTSIDLMFKYYPQDEKTDTGEPLITHLIESAKIVNNLDLHERSILATLFSYFPNYYPSNWKEKLKPYIDEETELLIEGLNQIQELTNFVKVAKFTTPEEQNKQSESMRKMLLAMVNDIRIVLIKLCMATQSMGNLANAPPNVDKRAIAKETLDIFAPLANRLGIWQLKWKLEDLGFQNQNPEEYKKIATLLNEKIDERLEYIKSFTNILKSELEKENIKCEVAGRPKHIYSIYRKMKKKKLEFDELYDIRAVRVLVETIPQCYNTLGIVHSLWKPISGEFDDYISNPKPNDYRSLHTVIIGPQNKGVEVQIRTFEMHDFAEFGIAAHWRYKEGGKEDSSYEKKIAWLRQLLEWRENVSETDKPNLANAFRTELFKDTIYVLTPMGKVLSLPNGSTPIDFAYALHSDIGNLCRGAKVNGHIVPLSTPLENGQRVEIITSKDGHPSVNWLYEGWVKSPKAVSKIRSFIRKQNIESVKEAGKTYLEKELYKLNRRPSLQDLVDYLEYKSLDDLYVAIGNGELTNKQLQKSIRTINSKNETIIEVQSKPVIKASQSRKVGDGGVLINGQSGLLSVFAKCCKPAPPDDIIGFVTRGRGISIHRKNCESFQHLAKKYPEKVLSAQWGNLDKNSDVFSVDIEILAQDRSGLLRDISDTFSRNKINVTGVQTHTGGTTAKMKFTVEIKQVSDLPKVLASLGNIEDVFEVHRI